jgi:hypothetical protein
MKKARTPEYGEFKPRHRGPMNIDDVIPPTRQTRWTRAGYNALAFFEWALDLYM